MIVPIGTSETEFRRVPWVTVSIAVVCIAIFTAVYPRMLEARHGAEQAADAVAAHFLKRPYLEIDPHVFTLLSGRYLHGEEGERLARLRETSVKPRSRARIEQEQRALIRLEERFKAALDALPSRVWGIAPSGSELRTWISHMFMHGSWEHLIGNMLILLLAGLCLEERWGRATFLAIYGLGGISGAALFGFRYPDSDVPLVGASGAISAVVGAFAVRFWASRVYFLYWFWLVVRGRFWLPAWLVTLAWIGQELALAYLIDATAPEAHGGPIAHWAHLGGFAFGASVALGVRAGGLEARFFEPAIESRVAQYQNTLVSRAFERSQAGDALGAFRLLRQQLPKSEYNRDAIVVLWDLALELGCVPDTASQVLRLVREDMRQGDLDSAAEFALDLAAQAPDMRLDAALYVRLACELAESGQIRPAREVAGVVLERVPASLPLPMPVRLVRALRDPDPKLAARVAARVLDISPEVTGEARGELEQVVANAPAEPEPW